jgi:3-phenylpropionate/trans-cinnamate dioxygenase ferredoxin reductase subunit
MSRIVIAGAGLAGLRAAQAAQAVQAAQAAGRDDELVLIGDERHPPYTRPPLSKELLAGDRTAAECAFPGLDTLDAELRLGVAVVGLDAEAHTVALSDGSQLGYSRLILATGCRARRLPGPAVSLLGLHTLRSVDDAERLAAALAPGTHLAIVGAGFVGCEVAATARGRGAQVTLIDVAEQPLTPLGPELGARIAALHRDHGVTLRLGVGVRGLQAEGDRVTGVALADGTTVAADLVLVALGALPNTEFLADTPIALAPGGGVLCDATLTSVSDPDVLAAGDIAAWPHPGADGERIRIEHWTNAAEHGRLAGANATREPAQRVAHTASPYVWSDQYDRKIQMVGFPARAARITIVEEDTDADPPRLVAEAHDVRGELVGAVTFNHVRRLAEYRRRLVLERV